MPNREFLEQYPLYRKFELRLRATLDSVEKVPIKRACPRCESDQTFVMTNEYYEGFEHVNVDTAGKVTRLRYLCTSCQTFQAFLLLRFSPKYDWVMKVGQYPPWEVAGDPTIESLLGEHASYLRRGLICESQGYGIGAFAYFRRIVEETIDDLLDQVADLMSEEELELYREPLAQTKAARNASEKIDLVKHLLPPILRPDGVNPLSTLHSVLSEGLHAQSDEECLALAAAVRSTLTFLCTQISASREAARAFTGSMKHLLDRKKPSAS